MEYNREKMHPGSGRYLDEDNNVVDVIDKVNEAIKVTVTNPSSGGVDPVGLKNIADETINPATLEGQQDIELSVDETKAAVDLVKAAVDLVEAEVAALNTRDFATETTLQDVKTAVESITLEDFATETTLQSIKTAVESIDSTDFATETTLSDLKDEVTNNISPKLETIDKSTSSLYTVLLDEVDSNTCYVGYAEPGSALGSAIWRIKKIVVSGTVLSVKFADGNTNFDNVWDNRVSLTYT